MRYCKYGFLRTILDPFVVEGLIEECRIGVTKSRATIFFQIDQEGRCRTGKIMKYDSETGHRWQVLHQREVIAFPDVDGFQEWTDKLEKLSDLDITVSPLL